MLVPALETLACAAEQQRAGGHQFLAPGRAVLEGSGTHQRDGVIGMPLFEWAVARPRAAHDVRDAPAIALGENAPHQHETVRASLTAIFAKMMRSLPAYKRI